MEDEETKKDEYESYVIVHNIAKRHNVGTLARSATASVLTVAVELFGYLWGNFGLQGLRE
ncbi:hypothetical protein CASFOL_021648 [Castilleja foliolosa]|uniref:Uncharacterized protein n=1 Tax=Castilleja foliolosa TaxID=1961234 RepID=A0ABD3CZU2_9LAMI